MDLQIVAIRTASSTSHPPLLAPPIAASSKVATRPYAKGPSMTSDTSEILAKEQQFLSAWNAGDARGSAAIYAEDGVSVGALGT